MSEGRRRLRRELEAVVDGLLRILEPATHRIVAEMELTEADRLELVKILAPATRWPAGPGREAAQRLFNLLTAGDDDSL